MKVQRPNEPHANNLNLIIARWAGNASDESEIRGDERHHPADVERTCYAPGCEWARRSYS
jgi:hypothetical protein